MPHVYYNMYTTISLANEDILHLANLVLPEGVFGFADSVLLS